MKILMLFDLAYRLNPDETLSPERLKEEQRPTEAEVMESLVRLGHSVETLAVFDNVTHIVEKLNTCVPDVVFNLCESFHHNRAHEPNIPALLELMKVRYTGAGPDALMLCKDKAITKKVLAYHHLRVPGFVVSHACPRFVGLSASSFRHLLSRAPRSLPMASAKPPLRATSAKRSSARNSFTRSSIATP